MYIYFNKFKKVLRWPTFVRLFILYSLGKMLFHLCVLLFFFCRIKTLYFSFNICYKIFGPQDGLYPLHRGSLPSICSNRYNIHRLIFIALTLFNSLFVSKRLFKIVKYCKGETAWFIKSKTEAKPMVWKNTKIFICGYYKRHLMHLYWLGIKT